MQSPHFSSLRGSAALSSFRLTKILDVLKSNAPSVDDDNGINHIYAEFVHFVFSDDTLTASQLSTLQQILTYGPKVTSEAPVVNCF